MNATLLKYPMMAGKIVAAIYFEALRLWWKKCPLYPHPHKNSKSRQQALDRAAYKRLTLLAIGPAC